MKFASFFHRLHASFVNLVIFYRYITTTITTTLLGTTLDFIKMKLPNGVTMIDTPGLLTKGQLTSKLNSEELRQVRVVIFSAFIPCVRHDVSALLIFV